MATPLADYLVRLGREAPIPDASRMLPEMPQAAEMSEATRLAEAAANGEAAGRAAASEEWRSRIAAEQVEFGRTLAAARASWAAEEGERLARLIAHGLHELEQAITEGLVCVLQPFVAAALRDKAVAALRESIATLLSGERPVVLRVSGPEDLVTRLRDGLSGTSAAIDCRFSDSAEVTVVSDATIIETQLHAFRQRFDQLCE